MPDLFISENKLEKKHQKSSSNKSKVGVLTAYFEKPSGVFFANQEEGEELILFLRRHLITNVPWILKALTMIILPPVIVLILNFINVSIPLPNNYVLIFTLFFYLVVFGYIFLQFITWFYNISLVTSERVVDIDFSQLVFESVAATKLTQVEDVSYHQVGVVRSIFDYGDVSVQTAGTATNFLFSGIPHPEKVVNIINDLIGTEPNA